MKNDIEVALSSLDERSVNISKIGKYDKFVEFKKDHLDQFQLVKDFIMFHTDEMKCEKLTKEDTFSAMENMMVNLEKRIQIELNQDYKLQDKIKEIKRKAAERIEKLESKPKKKLQDKYNYKYFEEYFKLEI